MDRTTSDAELPVTVDEFLSHPDRAVRLANRTGSVQLVDSNGKHQGVLYMARESLPELED